MKKIATGTAVYAMNFDLRTGLKSEIIKCFGTYKDGTDYMVDVDRELAEASGDPIGFARKQVEQAQ